MTKNPKSEEFEWSKFNIQIPTIIALFLCAFSLVFISLSLRPVAKWANYQAICVEQESLKSPIEWAVRKCNGRSKVYQVK